MTDYTRRIYKKVSYILGYGPLVFMLVYLYMTLFQHFAFVIPFSTYAWLVFKGTKDTVQGIGPIYWIVRSDNRLISVGFGTMHELSEPWRKGRGVYVAMFKRSIQIGVCYRQNLDDTAGTLSAVQGRYLDISASEIGNWNDIQKNNQARTTTA
jgi:hypothetical protein